MTYLPRDFVTTAEGLVFAVVDRSDDGETIPCFLRYHRSENGTIRKLDTTAANELLRRHYPKYLFHCDRRDADLHGVNPKDCVRHLRPRERMRALLDPAQPTDDFEARTARLLRAFASMGADIDSVGVTGSVLVGCHRADSDIDLVLYDTACFRHARESIPSLIERGILTPLGAEDWRTAYERRGCSLSYESFRWHEARKLNKAIFEGTKFDLSLCVETADDPPQVWRKLGAVRLSTRVIGDDHAFDYPARLRIAHQSIGEVVAFTATYCGQARVGEHIEVSGMLEQAAGGAQRVVVGTDREALGQYIRVTDASQPRSE